MPSLEAASHRSDLDDRGKGIDHGGIEFGGFTCQNVERLLRFLGPPVGPGTESWRRTR